MKSGLFKRILAMAMMTVMLVGDVIPTMAETVSGGDAAVVEDVESDTEEKTEETNDDVNPAPIETEEETESFTEEEETSVSDGDAEVVEIEEEETPLDDSMLTTLDSVTVDGITITVSGPKTAFAEGTTVSAVAVEPAEVVIEAAEENEQAVVKKYKAFDINLVCDGEFVQPLNGEEITVNFEGDMLIPDTDNNEDVAVYHVDEDDNLTKMDAAVAPLTIEDETIATETIEMTTTHFSTYIIVVTEGETDKKVTFKHYLGTPEERTEIYAPSEIIVHKDADEEYRHEIPVQGGKNYSMTSFVVTADGKSRTYTQDDNITNVEEINILSADTLIEIYYEENKQVYKNDTTFFDYYVDDIGMKEEGAELYQNDIIESFEMDGKTYKLYKVSDRDKGILEKDGKTITLKNNTVLKNVKKQSGAEWEYIIFKNRLFYKLVPGERSFNAGINSEAVQGQPFLAMGLSNTDDVLVKGEEWNVTNYRYYISKNGTSLNINTNNPAGNSEDGNVAIVPGLISSLNGTDYANVVMGSINGKQIQEPGYFTKDVSYNKAVYENYSLVFNQSGNTYVLDYALNNQNGNKTKSYKSEETINNEFFPLDDVTPINFSEDTKRTNFQPWDTGHNLYFGMRYDFTFNIGDYIGPMTYEFSGDDDLWVFVDGKLVLDLGGMHSAYPNRYAKHPEDNKVDLWSAVFGVDTSKENWWKDLTKEQKEEEHQVTVLYMERGGYESSCAMKFVIPNAEAKPPVVSGIPKADITLIKKDAENKETTISGVGFTLYSDENCDQVIGIEKFTNEEGKVVFSGLKEGTYYLKETSYDTSLYKPNDEIYIVTVITRGDTASASMRSKHGGEIEKNGEAYVIYNERLPKGKLEIEKKSSEKGHKEIKGVGFTLYYDENCTSVFREEKFTDKDGEVEFKNLPIGTYYLKETHFDESKYEANDIVYKVMVEWNGKKVVTKLYDGDIECEKEDEDDDDDYIIYNTPIVTLDLNFIKVDLNNHNKTLENAQFVLKDENGKQIGETQTSAADGSFSFSNIKKGTYFLEEITVPDGYVSPAKEWKIVVEKYDDLTSRNYPGTWIAHKEGDELAFAVIDGPSGLWRTAEGDAGKMLIKNTPAIGSLKIVKAVNKVDDVHGDATFTFKITCPDNSVLYRTMIFTAAGTQETVIENLPAGSYIVEELDALRYECKSEKVQEKAVMAGADEPTVFEYSNEKVFENYYSHTDTVVNIVTFERNADGTIKGSTITQQTKTDND